MRTLNHPVLHLIHTSKLITLMLLAYAFGMFLFIISVPLKANQDAYSWSTLQNVMYLSFGRLGLVSSFAAMIVLEITCKGVLKNIYIWRPLARLTFAAYIFHPMGPALQYYMTDTHTFIDSKSVIYFILCTFVT